MADGGAPPAGCRLRGARRRRRRPGARRGPRREGAREGGRLHVQGGAERRAVRPRASRRRVRSRGATSRGRRFGHEKGRTKDRNAKLRCAAILIEHHPRARRSWRLRAALGAGRKPSGARAGESHRVRVAVDGHDTLHVTNRVRGVPSLRTERCMAALRGAFRAGRDRFGFRLVHCAVQPDHPHLDVDAAAPIVASDPRCDQTPATPRAGRAPRAAMACRRAGAMARARSGTCWGARSPSASCRSP